MSADKRNITIERGTNQPIILSFNKAGEPISLTDCTIGFAVKTGDGWDTSPDDSTALVKKLIHCYEVQLETELSGIVANVGDLCWVYEFNNVRRWDGTAWSDGNTDTNNIIVGQISIPFEQTDFLIPVDKYFYSIDIKFPDGEVSKVVKGSFNVLYNTINYI